jgi:hypothetical protein
MAPSYHVEKMLHDKSGPHGSECRRESSTKRGFDAW